ALERVGEVFAANPKASLIQAESVFEVNGWKFSGPYQAAWNPRVESGPAGIALAPPLFFRRAAYDAVGGVRRDLHLAGDYDIWLRLSARYQAVKTRGHLICRRVLLSPSKTNFEAYAREAEIARQDFLRTVSPLRSLRWKGQSIVSLVRDSLDLLARKDERFYFPADPAKDPPPPVVVDYAEGCKALSPIDRKPADRFLFSALASSPAGRKIYPVYLDTRHAIAVVGSPGDVRVDDRGFPPETIGDALWTIPADQASASPGFGRRFAEMFEYPMQLKGKDTTLGELKRVLKAAKFDFAKPISILDAACSEGAFLDRVREETPWTAAGLESNPQAVRICREKGHRVWHGSPDSAIESLPEEDRFELIFMNQTIQRVDDPLRVIRKLRRLLEAGGVLVLSTPNLDSRAIGRFGTIWPHWNPSANRYIFSRKGLIALARQAGLKPIGFRTFSDPHRTQAAQAASTGSEFPRDLPEPESMVSARWNGFLYQAIRDRLGRSERLYVLLRDDSDD
ncbi:MAG: bifunctional glycosyltransferase/class I SAM-dependent methyltransferase, partial [Gammaproteobacteria bacterium]